MAQATKTRFDKDCVVYVNLRDAWYRIDGDAGEPVPEGFNPNELLTAEQLQAHIKAQAADLSAESPKQRARMALGQVWRLADGQEATVVEYDEGDNTFFLMNNEDGDWFCPDGTAICESEREVIAVEYLRETDRPRIEVGKKYRTASGKIVKIVEDDATSLPFLGDDGVWYYQFGFQYDDCDHIVALVEEEPAKAEQPAEEPKQRPAFAIGQVWRMADGQEATVVVHYTKDNTFLLMNDESAEWFYPDGMGLDERKRGVVAVEYLRETDRPRLEVGKRYRTASGKIVTIVANDGFPLPFMGDNGNWYQQFGFRLNGIPLVALVEEEPTKAEQPAEKPKKNPPLAVGQVWRLRNGQETLIFRAYEGGGFRHGSLDKQNTGVARESGCLESHLVEYLRETDRVRIELGREYLRSDGKKAKVVKDKHNGGVFADDLGCYYNQFSWWNNITLDKELPTPGDEVSYFSQDEDKWLSGWIVRGTNEDGTTTFLIPKELEEGGHTKFGVATEHVRIDVRSTIPPRNIGDLWRRRDGELYAINYYHEQITSLSEGHYPHGDLVQYVGKAMAAAGDVLAQFTHQDDAISFVKQNSTNERRLTIVKYAQPHGIPSLGPWIVHKILYLPTLAIEIE